MPVRINDRSAKTSHVKNWDSMTLPEKEQWYWENIHGRN